VDRVLGALPPTNIDEVEIRSNGSEVVVVALGRAPASDWVDAVAALPQVVGVSHGARAVRGCVDLSFPFAEGKRRDVGPSTFFQVNLELNELLVSAVLERVRARQPHAVLDLFAGAGNFGLPLLAAGVAVTAIESDANAVRDLERAIAAHRASRREGRARGCESLHAGGDVLRRGNPRPAARRSARAPRASRRHATDGDFYVSCNARTLGRDLAHLAGTRWRKSSCSTCFRRRSTRKSSRCWRASSGGPSLREVLLGGPDDHDRACFTRAVHPVGPCDRGGASGVWLQ
jgi:hypothetical protein